MHYSHQTASLYSQIFDHAITDLLWGVGSSSRYVVKKISGKEYMYRQINIGSAQVDISLGRHTEELDLLIQKSKNHQPESIRSLTMMFNSDPVVSKLSTTVNKMIDVIADFGVFKSGGVLLGSSVMHFYANMLGYKFAPEAVQTVDVDITGIEASEGISIMFDNVLEVPLDELLLSKGFDKILSLNHKDPVTSFSPPQKTKSTQKPHIDVLCPMKGPTSSKPVYVKQFKCYAEPLRYLEYLSDNTQLSVMNNGSGTLIRVPDPARFALHKLVVSTRRPASEQTKSRKDIYQARLLLDFLIEERPDDVVEAYNAASKMGSKFLAIIDKQLAKLGLDDFIKDNLAQLMRDAENEGGSKLGL